MRQYQPDIYKIKKLNVEPSVCVRDDGDLWVQAADHLRGLNKVVQCSDGQVGLAESRSRCGSPTLI